MPRARFWVLVALLGAAVATAFYLRRSNQVAGALRPGLLQTSIDEPEFQPSASQEQLLALAQRTAAELVTDYPGDAQALNVQARRHYLLIETDAAVRLWRECLDLDPDYPDAFFGLGLVATDRGEYEEAIERYQDVARLDGDDPRVPVLLAKNLLLAGRAEDAVLILEQHVTTQRTSVEAWEMLGQAHLQAQQFDRAAQCFEVAVESLPTLRDALYGLARSHAGLGDTQKAEFYAEKFRKLDDARRTKNNEDAQAGDPRFAWRVAAQTYADAARVRTAHGDARRAEDHLLRAVLLQPASTSHLEQLQRSLQERGADAEAAEVGERIVQIAPQQLEQWLNLGWLYSKLQQPNQAIAACKKAIELNPDDPRCRQAHEIIQRFQ
ncbi:MAG: tetratricopeptide repeat protein [Planctomycetes bacterium]|nr:tetratricopeptide repeat protein [Planctomycetota bacterium]